MNEIKFKNFTHNNRPIHSYPVENTINQRTQVIGLGTITKTSAYPGEQTEAKQASPLYTQDRHIQHLDSLNDPHREYQYLKGIIKYLYRTYAIIFEMSPSFISQYDEKNWAKILHADIRIGEYTEYEKKIIHRLHNHDNWQCDQIAFVMRRTYKSIKKCLINTSKNILRFPFCRQGVPNNRMDALSLCQEIIPHLLNHGLDSKEIDFIFGQKVNDIPNYIGIHRDTMPSKQQTSGSSLHSDHSSTIDSAIVEVRVLKRENFLCVKNEFINYFYLKDKIQDIIRSIDIRPSKDIHIYRRRYTKYENEILYKLRQHNWTYRQLGFVMQRTVTAINKHMCQSKKKFRSSHLNAAQGLPRDEMKKHPLCNKIIPHLVKHGLDAKEIAFIFGQKVNDISNYIRINGYSMPSKQQTSGSSLQSDQSSTIDSTTIDSEILDLTMPKRKKLDYLKPKYQLLNMDDYTCSLSRPLLFTYMKGVVGTISNQ